MRCAAHATVRPPLPDPLDHAQVRIWFWNAAGSQHLYCPLREANHIRRCLIAEGAIVWHSEIVNP
jgi:hypothetical protein